MNETLVRTCINFNYESGAYDDDDCEAYYYLDAMCEFNPCLPSSTTISSTATDDYNSSTTKDFSSTTNP
jgi:hypothetical protein